MTGAASKSTHPNPSSSASTPGGGGDSLDDRGTVLGSGVRETTGRISLDGNNPWIEIWAEGRWHAERFGWSLVLAVLNDPHESPIWFGKRMQYEV